MGPKNVANRYIPPTTDKSQLAIWQRVNWMLDELDRLNQRLEGLGTGQQARLIADLRVQIAAVQDELTQAQTFVGAGGTNFNATGASLTATGDGLEITGTTGAGVINVTSPSALRAAAEAARVATPAIVAATIPLAKITGGGVDGSISVNVEGIVTAYVAPT